MQNKNDLFKFLVLSIKCLYYIVITFSMIIDIQPQVVTNFRILYKKRNLKIFEVIFIVLML